MSNKSTKLPANKVLFEPREYVKFAFRKKGLTLNTAGLKGALLSTLVLDYEELLQVYKSSTGEFRTKGISEKQIQHAFQEHLQNLAEEERQETINSVMCTQASLLELRRWVKAVTGSEKETDTATMAHWIWQIKRKALDKEVVHHVMPVLYGKQGGGKTFALERLIAPLSKMKLEMNMTQLTDSRLYEGFSNNLVVLFDELQGIDRTDLNALKHQITTRINTFRRLHSHSTVTVPQRCSFIGATNKHLNENFSDSTGMRRFYEITAQDKLDWKEINSIDYNALWQGIDENIEGGYIKDDMLVQVRQIQESYKDEDDTDTFIEEYKLRVEGTEYKTLSKGEVYNAYVTWASLNGVRATSSQWLTKRLKARQIETVKDSSGRYFRVSVECLVGNKLKAVGGEK